MAARPVTSLNGVSLKFVRTSSLRLITDPTHLRYDKRIEMPLGSEFAADVKLKGVKIPIVVRPDGEILDGKQRFRAATAGGIDLVPVIEYGGEMSDLDAWMMRCSANNLRVNDDPATRIEDARRAFAMGADVESVARSFGVQPSTAESYMNILDNATPETMKLVAENAVSIAAAAIIADQAPEAQPKIVEKIRESQVLALTAPNGKDSSITGSQKGDTRVETVPETGEQRPVTTVGAVAEIAAKVGGKKREQRKAAPKEVTIKVAPSAVRSEQTLAHRIAMVNAVSGLHPESREVLEAVGLALRWAKGEEIVAPEGSTYAAAFARLFAAPSEATKA